MHPDPLDDPFHPGEREAQARAGFRVPSAPIRDVLIPQHRDFYPLLPFLLVAAADAQGAPSAGILTGPPGFVTSPDPRILRIRPEHGAWDGWPGGPAPGAAVGALGIDLATRRRNRVNGTVIAADGGGFDLMVEQSFGNCPQYIQGRLVETAAPVAAPREPLGGLDADARRAIAEADTVFVASSSTPGVEGGFDVSHRGGPAGFIRIDGDRLTVPDYSGNRYFNTLGNFLVNPQAGLLIVDFATGDALHLTGRVGIDWEPPGDLPGAQRSWSLTVERGWRQRAAIPLRWSFRDQSPATLRIIAGAA
ncbi:putative pyridoxine 5'-phosphate oxidase superfamily flavin-nucleotide-binding protein [Azospirillum agricola]|uniref:pyridoxamine 5'-phosphate oxidase family protein n=1 Tax=Azospirillum agricola TaxID=1720247 RepID=UPI001AE8BFD9|nr:pyridoxamine 5'-phosphate oxidase family protein [Azospirillum agricola]MBP2232767.1 putative pyridoxine 5'-phosphate oxidase superfamily flavin-nucleotide-binding protein [Azospirillum agricola]